MAEQEHWSAYDAGIPGPTGTHWVVGRGMRVMAACQRPEDAERIASDHNRVEALHAELAAERERAKAVVFRATAMIGGIGQWMNEGDGVWRCIACRAPVESTGSYWRASHQPGCAVVELRKAIAAYGQHQGGVLPTQAQEG